MTTETKIPNIGEIVLFANKRFKVMSCNIGGKCKIKKLELPNKGIILNEIDVKELIF